MRGFTVFKAGTAVCALIAALAVTPEAMTAAPEQSRLHVQIRNVEQGQALRLSLSNQGVADLRLLDVRAGGAAERVSPGAVRIDGRDLLISAGDTALSVNLTIGLVCRPTCPAELTGQARIPTASYAFLRTAVADQAITQSGAWAVRLTSD
ncbi:MAG: hypothetical protein O2985_11420 [Proteobacteria bacterium]|nr:hypothetical protein [Pseudomonadota bacterium]